jgi:beta-glucosidase
LQGDQEGTGNRLYVDDKLVIDDWKLCRAQQPGVTLQLSAGPHKIVVEDFQNSQVGGTLRVGIADQHKLVSEAAKTLAHHVDAVIVAVGFDPNSEDEGCDRSFQLPFGQEELIRELSAANAKTVVALTAGGNVDSGTWLDRVPSYIHMWYPGEQGGTALAEILFGAVDLPGGCP